VQVSCAGIISEPRPVMKNVIDMRVRQHIYIRKRLHEPEKIGSNSLDLRLLQHDLGNPHPIWRRVVLPRQVIAATSLEPVQYSTGKVLHRATLEMQI